MASELGALPSLVVDTPTQGLGIPLPPRPMMLTLEGEALPTAVSQRAVTPKGRPRHYSLVGGA
ncbi:MAG: hypothetical protein WCA77_05880 [Thermoplasmata archaeon]